MEQPGPVLIVISAIALAAIGCAFHVSYVAAPPAGSNSQGPGDGG